VAAGALFGQSLLGYISPEPARLNGNTFPAGSLLSAPTTPARLPLRWFNTSSVTSRRTPRRCSPVTRVRRRSCSHQPETPDAVSSADFAFDQPLKGVPRSPGKTGASFASWRAPRTSPGPSDGRACRSFLAGSLSGTRCGTPFLVRVAGIVQVAKSSESSAHVPLPRVAGRSASIDGRLGRRGWRWPRLKGRRAQLFRPRDIDEGFGVNSARGEALLHLKMGAWCERVNKS
jgi:hypothetical protein